MGMTIEVERVDTYKIPNTVEGIQFANDLEQALMIHGMHISRKTYKGRITVTARCNFEG